MFIPTLANTANATTLAVTNIKVIIILFLSLVIVIQSFYRCSHCSFLIPCFFISDAKVMPFVLVHNKKQPNKPISLFLLIFIKYRKCRN